MWGLAGQSRTGAPTMRDRHADRQVMSRRRADFVPLRHISVVGAAYARREVSPAHEPAARATAASRASGPRASIEEGLSTIGAGLRRNAAAHAEFMTGHITPVMPDLGEEGRTQIFRSCLANIDVVAELLDRPPAMAVADLPPPPPQTLSYMRMLVHRALDIESLVRGYRVGHAALWRCCLREAFAGIECPEDTPGVLERCSDIVFAYIDAATQFVAEEFEVERHAHMRWPVARKVEAVVAVLEGQYAAPAGELSAALGYEVDRAHSGFVLHAPLADEQGRSARPRPEVLAVRLCRLIAPGIRPLVLPVGDDLVWMWVGGTPASSLDCEEIERTIEEHEAFVGVGEIGAGLDGFRTTHAEARDALDVARVTGRRVARYRDVALVSVLKADPERARRLVEHELGDLDAENPAAERLRDTLRTLLASNLNQREAARRLDAHPHTIAYRLSRLEKILGHPVADRAHELHAALLLRDLLRRPPH